MSDLNSQGFDREEWQRAVEELKNYYESTGFYRFLLKIVDVLSKWLDRR